ncbi:40s ribosomal protein s2-like [Lynx pardinus]|uniref:40s ribosomal protein s2-like n=1 Tax=Lynx pardinus TaxID=191816 RepID=A0A485PKG8_LYNPA|nr:40s ribosomal protein s2-like [Lynx pardinus]
MLVPRKGLESPGLWLPQRLRQQHVGPESWPWSRLGQDHGTHRGNTKDKEWISINKLSQLVDIMKIKSLKEISLFSLPIKESEIIDFFLETSQEVMRFEVLKIMPVQKQTQAGQRTRCKAFVAIGEYKGHIGLGVKFSKETILMMGGIDDCYLSTRGYTATLGQFTKATFDAIPKTYSYCAPDLWKETVFTKSPCQEFTDQLAKTHTRVSVQKTQAPAVATTWFYTRKIK